MEITSNKTKRTYTVKIDGHKYTTMRMSKVEFDEAYFNTKMDWINYFRSC